MPGGGTRNRGQLQLPRLSQTYREPSVAQAPKDRRRVLFILAILASGVVLLVPVWSWHKIDDAKPWTPLDFTNLTIQPPNDSKHHLVFVGDSVSVYQYLALALALHYRQFVGHQTQYWGILSEAAWRGGKIHTSYHNRWANYYAGTNAYFEGQEICDCYREDCLPLCVPQSVAGNRFYYVNHSASQEAQTEEQMEEFAPNFEIPSYELDELIDFWNDTARVGVVFSGGTIVRSRGRYSYRKTLQELRSQQETYIRTGAVIGGPIRVWDTQGSNDVNMLLQVIDEVRPTIMVLGMDNHWPRDRPIQGDSYCALAQKLDVEVKRRDYSVQLVLRTNGVVSEVPREAVPRCFVCENILVYDVWSISQKVRQTVMADYLFFTDDFHYQPWVYDKLNLALLQLLGYGTNAQGYASQTTSTSMPTEGNHTCLRPACADCLAFWRYDSFYGRYNFKCPQCSVRFMKPTMSEEEVAEWKVAQQIAASQAAAQAKLTAEKRAQKLWNETVSVREEATSQANEIMKNAWQQAESILSAARTEASKLTTQASLKAESVSVAVQERLHIQIKGELKEVIKRFRQQILKENQKLRTVEKVLENATHELEKTSFMSLRKKSELNDKIATFQKQVNKENVKVQNLTRVKNVLLKNFEHMKDIISNATHAADKVMAVAKGKAVAFIQNGNRQSAEVMKSAEINVAQITMEALRLTDVP